LLSCVEMGEEGQEGKKEGEGGGKSSSWVMSSSARDIDGSLERGEREGEN